MSESVFMVGEGGIGTRGSVEEDGQDAVPAVYVAGIYTGSGPEQQLLGCPQWTGLSIDPPIAADERILDLRTGVLHRRETTMDKDFRSFRFACADRPGVFVLRAEAAESRLEPGAALRDAASSGCEAESSHDETRSIRTTSDVAGAVVAAATQRIVNDGGHRTVDRIAVYIAEKPGERTAHRAMGELSEVRARGVDRLLRDQEAAWAQRWSAVGIDLPDAPDVELAVRFALFQLWCNANAHGESAVGARGVSGSGYRGHVFWDSDVFVLPAMVSIDPAAAAAMVAYRMRRLPAARQRARANDCRGARFPWESAADGTDVTPTAGHLGGTPVTILTGRMEEHITADVAWAADYYAEWTGQPEFTGETVRELLTDTAAYWVSRCRLDPTGRAHLDRVIGPDEYHEAVDDNAYTNVMARWNLRRAARLQPRDAAEASEFAAWRWLADRIVDQRQPDGRYEQFTGYFGLEPLVAADVARPPVAADVLLGPARVAGSQLIKQPDVLMLHHLVPDEVAPGSLIPNLDFYGPRTTHGSSLSPAIMAALLARAGRPDEALAMLRIALRLDLDDRTGTTAAGLHLATLAGVWQAMLTGFAGVRVRGGVLRVRPVLPAGWYRLGLSFRCLGVCVRLDITGDGIAVRADGAIAVGVYDRAPIELGGALWFPREESGHE
ncbi:glycoside hydrolase family 65 protein [Nocardia sp. CS682]|uniref:glycoside hydrolase family 65 protein n=1 Tax=Nocardia sp. CS682 TaxID=1047172 RepID=UPI001430509A|nr:glycoside hydrolase family 65 protein [Nocardia sp. CS682]